MCLKMNKNSLRRRAESITSLGQPMSGHISSYRVFRTDRPYASNGRWHHDVLPMRRWHDPDEPCPFPNSGPQPAAAPRRPDRRTQRHARRRSVEPEVRSGMVANRWRPHPRCGRQRNCHRPDCASVSRHVARSVTRSRLVPAGSGPPEPQEANPATMARMANVRTSRFFMDQLHRGGSSGRYHCCHSYSASRCSPPLKSSCISYGLGLCLAANEKAASIP